MAEKLDPKAVPDYFSEAGTVERWWSPHAGPLSFHYDAELTILDDHVEVGSNCRVLDVGTGRGRFAIHFARQGCQIVAVDINQEMLAVAREAAEQEGFGSAIDFREANAEDLSEVVTNDFDIVLCMELFDHLPDLTKALASMRSRLDSRGRFVFTYVPSESIYGFLGNIYRWIRRRWNPQSTMISRTYSLFEVTEALARSGLELDEYFGVGVLCINAQTRLFQGSLLARLTLFPARAEAKFWPYHSGGVLGRMGAHVVGVAKPVEGSLP